MNVLIIMDFDMDRQTDRHRIILNPQNFIVVSNKRILYSRSREQNQTINKVYF